MSKRRPRTLPTLAPCTAPRSAPWPARSRLRSLLPVYVQRKRGAARHPPPHSPGQKADHTASCGDWTELQGTMGVLKGAGGVSRVKVQPPEGLRGMQGSEREVRT